jgi:hypothetical protein
MKIIEAIKELRIIEKKMNKNIQMVEEYSSILSTERPAFGDPMSQIKKVHELIQSNTDLLERYLYLKKAIEKSNLEISVEVGGKKYLISDALTIKRKMATYMLDTYNALNIKKSEAKMNSSKRFLTMDSKPNQVVDIERMYDEKEKLAGLSVWQDLYDNIESRLEVINATTDLIEQ